MIKNDRLLKSIAEGRVERLFQLAKDRTFAKGGSDALSKRYVGIAESIIKHYRIGTVPRVKNEVCKRCRSVLIPGINCSVRLVSSRGYAAVLCSCGEEKHIFYK